MPRKTLPALAVRADIFTAKAKSIAFSKIVEMFETPRSSKRRKAAEPEPETTADTPTTARRSARHSKPSRKQTELEQQAEEDSVRSTRTRQANVRASVESTPKRTNDTASVTPSSRRTSGRRRTKIQDNVHDRDRDHSPASPDEVAKVSGKTIFATRSSSRRTGTTVEPHVEQYTPSRKGRKKRAKTVDMVEDRDASVDQVYPLPNDDGVVESLNGYATLDTTGLVHRRKPPSKHQQDFQETHKSNLSLTDILHASLKYDLLRRIALSKLTSRRPTPLQHLASVHGQVSQLLSSTVNAGQGNSLLLLGSRGAGKSTIVDSVIQELASDPNNIASDGSQTFHVIRLNGFIQTDDKLALREIWRQLGREMEVEDDDGKARNYADTLASLLGLLSHPSELPASTEMDGVAASGTSHQDTTHSEQLSNAVIFVISEFDAFASHARQTLLYNLFDVAQSRKAPIAVLGLSTRMDVADMLEKRVKSRFSHRYIHVPPPRTFSAFLDVCRAAAAVTHEELAYDEQQELARTTPDSLKQWNVAATALLEDEVISTQLQQIYATTRSVPTAFSALYLHIATLDPPNSTLNHLAFPTPTVPLTSPKLTHLPSLPTLSLALLIAAARLPLLTNNDLVSFALAYDEYRSLATKARLNASGGGAQVHGGVAGRVWGREIARAAWEGLCECGLVMPEDREDVMGAGLCWVDVALEEIEPAMEGMGLEGMEGWVKGL